MLSSGELLGDDGLVLIVKEKKEKRSKWKMNPTSIAESAETAANFCAVTHVPGDITDCVSIHL
jgi:hypothetical protein